VSAAVELGRVWMPSLLRGLQDREGALPPLAPRQRLRVRSRPTRRDALQQGAGSPDEWRPVGDVLRRAEEGGGEGDGVVRDGVGALRPSWSDLRTWTPDRP
jgi:hypothetical protein